MVQGNKPGCDGLGLRILGSDFSHLLQSGSLGERLVCRRFIRNTLETRAGRGEGEDAKLGRGRNQAMMSFPRESQSSEHEMALQDCLLVKKDLQLKAFCWQHSQ